MGDGVDFSVDLGDKLVAKPWPLGAAHEAGDVNEVSRVGLSWASGELCEYFETRIGHHHFADVGSIVLNG